MALSLDSGYGPDPTKDLVLEAHICLDRQDFDRFQHVVVQLQEAGENDEVKDLLADARRTPGYHVRETASASAST